ncbi:MAG: hypothetical protein EZS28_040348 [Streblomastix strix]|uniref:Uncharacterized protein n=1 Tax=Streblomastix strix TaxID=222440 RepID=A0A5J4U3A2_9EUKA|nr:MAG: hypothetical protein EZS28_040348 [Streblomastix strix]
MDRHQQQDISLGNRIKKQIRYQGCRWQGIIQQGKKNQRKFNEFVSGNNSGFVSSKNNAKHCRYYTIGRDKTVKRDNNQRKKINGQRESAINKIEYEEEESKSSSGQNVGFRVKLGQDGARLFQHPSEAS